MKIRFFFNKFEKIKKNTEFVNVIKTGLKFKSKYYLCYYKRNGLEYSRIGLVVKKRIGNSVKRNYEKRILREFFRNNKYLLNFNYDLILILLDNKACYNEKKIDFVDILHIIQNDVI